MFNMIDRRSPQAEPVLEVSTDQQVYARRHLARKTLRGFREMRDLKDGFALAYPNTSKWARQLAEFTNHWTTRYPLLTTELVC